MHRKVLHNGKASKHLILEHNEENVKAIFTILAIHTKMNKDSAEYQFLVQHSTSSAPLSTYRREYLAILKLLYKECFYVNERFFLPIVDSERLQTVAKGQIIGKCYHMLAEAICKRLFNDVEQLTCGSLTLDVPTVKGNLHYRLNAIAIYYLLVF